MKTKLILLTAVLAVSAAQTASLETTYEEVYAKRPAVKALYDADMKRGEHPMLILAIIQDMITSTSKDRPEFRMLRSNQLNDYAARYNQVLNDYPKIRAHVDQQTQLGRPLDPDISGGLELTAGLAMNPNDRDGITRARDALSQAITKANKL